MKIKTRITFKEYVKLLYGLTYKKPMMIVILCVGVAMIIWITGYYLHYLPVPKPMFYQYTTLTLISVVQPLAIFLTIRKNYYSGNHLQEPLQIELLPEDIKMTGNSFYMEIKWEKMFKIVELPNWFLLYQNNLSAIIIPKKAFNERQENEFRKILRSVKKVPVKLEKHSE